MTSIEQIAAKALRLPKDQRLSLAHRIISSVEPAETRYIKAAWDREIRKRIRRYEKDSSCAIKGRKVFAELDDKLRG